jgi:hypothetical protein
MSGSALQQTITVASLSAAVFVYSPWQYWCWLPGLCPRFRAKLLKLFDPAPFFVRRCWDLSDQIYRERGHSRAAGFGRLRFCPL